MNREEIKDRKKKKKKIINMVINLLFCLSIGSLKHIIIYASIFMRTIMFVCPTRMSFKQIWSNQIRHNANYYNTWHLRPFPRCINEWKTRSTRTHIGVFFPLVFLQHIIGICKCVFDIRYTCACKYVFTHMCIQMYVI